MNDDEKDATREAQMPPTNLLFPLGERADWSRLIQENQDTHTGGAETRTEQVTKEESDAFQKQLTATFMSHMREKYGRGWTQEEVNSEFDVWLTGDTLTAAEKRARSKLAKDAGISDVDAFFLALMSETK